MLIVVLVSIQKKVKSSESFYHLREYICHHEQNVTRDRNIISASGEALEGNDEHAFEHLKKGDLCNKVAEPWLN